MSFLRFERKIMEAFTTKTGIQTELVGIDEAQFPQLIASAAQSGTLPDVVASLGLGSVRQIDQFGLVDRRAPLCVRKRRFASLRIASLCSTVSHSERTP